MDYKKSIQNKGLKQNWLAKKLGVSESLLSMFLKGNRNLSPEKESMLKGILS